MLSVLAAYSGLCLLAVWVGYPAIMTLLSRMPRRARTIPLPTTLPTVSVVIATREGVEAIGPRVEDVLRAEYPADRLTVVVAIDAVVSVAADGLGASEPRVFFVRGDAPGGKAAGLNAGVRAATGEVIIFTDTHQRFHPHTIAELVGGLSDRRVGGVSGSLHNPPRATDRSLADRYWSYERRLREAEAAVHSTVGATGAVWAVRRDLWAPLPTGLILDDVYTPMRLVMRGHRIGFARSAMAYETRHFTPVQEYQRKVRTLTGVVQLCAWLPGILIPVVNPIWTQFVFHKLLRLFTPYWAAIIILWTVLAGGRYVGAALHPGAAALVVLSMLAMFSLARFRRVAREGWLLQAAVVIAAVNGLRGRWDVWQR